MTRDSSIQSISRLTPLSAILALIEARVARVRSRKSTIQDARDFTLAEDVVATLLPPSAIALRDGYAVEAAAVADAGPYAPLPFNKVPPRVDAGEPMPAGTDAVTPFDAVTVRGNFAEATAAVAAGDGALAAGADATPRAPLRRAGERLRAVDIAVLTASGIAEVTVRAPRVQIVYGGAATTPLLEAARAMLLRAVASAGATAIEAAGPLDQALGEDRADAIIAIGGTGSGRSDAGVRSLARLGRVAAHGIAISPGETAAFGFAGERPVLLAPGRLDAALAVWLLIGRPLVAKLAGGCVEDAPATLPLKRKVTSTIGLTEMVPVSCAGGMAEPLGSGYLSFAALTRSDGWIVIAADSEGCDAGTQVAVRPWP